jgi:Cof subfamily protein (haloacid dehalogenase superfamily)
MLEEAPIALSKTNGRLRFEVGAFDLDGTVLGRDLSISDATLRALAALRERGVRLVVATGRSYESAREQAGRLGFGGDDPLVCYGGSMVRRMGGETLLSHPVAPDAALDVLQWAAGLGLHARVFVDGRVVVPEGEPPDAAVLPTRPPKGEPPPHLVVVGDVAGWLRATGEEVMKVVIVDKPEGVEGWLGEAQQTFAGRLHVTRSLPHYVEVGSPEGNKAEALHFLCGSWGVEPGRVLAFGDADNDVEMLRFAGLGVAVGGGISPAVRKAADATAPSVDEDGVARFVDGLLKEGGV